MKEMVLNNMTAYSREMEESAKDVHGRWMAGLVVSSVLGTFSGFGGMMIGLLSLLGLLGDGSSLPTVGTWLIVMVFPLFVGAAHALDKIHEAENAMRREYCRKHGLRDEDC